MFFRLILLFLINITYLYSQPTTKTIHILVALCDNENQGISPVPQKLGNGLDARNNLYWGALYGVKAYFKKSSQWKLIQSSKELNTDIAERIIFKHISKSIYLVADAYYGDKIEEAIYNTISYVHGNQDTIIDISQGASKLNLNVGGAANLIVYIGHNGLMEFDFDNNFKKSDSKKREFIILACMSKSYFKDYLIKSGAEPLLWTTGLMAPEAYILLNALNGWVLNESKTDIHTRAAESYKKFQKCSLKAAQNLFSTKW